VGLNQLFVSGTPYERGLAEGRHTRALMEREESALTEKFVEVFPNAIVRRVFSTVLMRWFWGIDRYFEPWMLQEMYGMSKAASPRFDGYLDAYTRQLAYHGLHEVGQMFVDYGQKDMGCTVFAVPSSGGWMIGRNFDFEGGRIFDEEKILKWITPDQGHRLVAVTWAGMVGVVTGVNDQGVYISINAAGSSDFRRYGTPTTLVVLKALQFSQTAEEAVEIFKEATTFITDIFVVADKHHVFRIEKSPRQFWVEELKGPTVITNHLESPLWAKDKTNEFRRRELTSEARFLRGHILLDSLKNSPPSADRILGFLRDKRSVSGKALPLGNRAAIDALIASHSVIYDSQREILYVGKGPSVAGEFLGFDLKTSFMGTGPAKVGETLPRDPEVSTDLYAKIKEADAEVSLAAKELAKKDCEAAWKHLQASALLYAEDSHYFTVLGNYYSCRHEKAEAIRAWKEALGRSPAYLQERKSLERKLKS
jgi:Acyl-coenzyme A:6-aminopenicillanic acid acyl-transferase